MLPMLIKENLVRKQHMISQVFTRQLPIINIKIQKASIFMNF